MGRELIIQSDEAYAIADDLAHRLDVSTTEVVEAALRNYRTSIKTKPRTLTPEEKLSLRKDILALAARARAELGDRAVPDIDTMLYDENGLPR